MGQKDQKDQGVIRVNVSVPRALKARMDAVRQPVNWSQVAAHAFEAKLLDLQAKQEVTNMDEVVARLKAAAAQEENEDYQAGLKAGRSWAMEDAKPKELRRIADYIDRAGRENWCWYDVDSTAWNAPFGATDHFVIAAWSEARNERDLLAVFWEQALGDDAARVEDADFFHGFGDAVAEVWEQVADKL
jgi:hypothetical protein